MFIADGLWSSGNNKLSLVVLLLMQSGTALLLVLLLSRGRRLDGVDLIGAIAFALAMLLWFEQHEALSWPFEVQVAAVSMFAVASFAVLALNPEYKCGRTGCAACRCVNLQHGKRHCCAAVACLACFLAQALVG